jgi:hypothetical protein
MAMNINYIDFKVAVLLPNGTEYIKDYVSSVPFPTIGEKKRAIMSFTTDYNMANVNLWIKFALFNQGIFSVSPSIAKSPMDYAITFPPTITAGTYPIAFICPSGLNSNVQQNAEANLIIVDSTHFRIEFDFYQIYDELSYQNTSIQDNHSKLLKDCSVAPSELTLSSNKNCYNSNLSKLCTTFRFEKGADFSDISMSSVWNSSFYNRNPINNSPYFNTPVWTLERTIPVTNLSTITNTNVKFNINGATAVTKILGWIIRTDNFDNTVFMFDNYEADFKDIISTNPDLNDKIIAPIVDISLLSGSTYEVQYTIDASKLVGGAKYRLIAIVYDNVGLKSNSFISDEYIVDHVPCFDGAGFNLIGSLSDYDREFTGSDLECVIEERIKSKIYFDYNANQWADDILDRLGITTSNDFRRYLTKVKFDIYDENNVVGLGFVRNYYISETSNKYGINSYTSVNGMNLDFTNIDEPIFSFDWRNRFENNIDCLLTTIDNVPVTPVQAKQYWGGKTLKVRWQLFFYYDDYATPFEDIIEMFQQIRVLDYGNMKVLHDNVDGIRSNWDATANCCQGDEFCMGGVLDDPKDAIDRRLIVNICPNLASVNTLEEAEAWVGDKLPQLTSSSIVNEDIDYTTIYTKKAARFCIDTSKLSVNSYKISAMAKKYVA